MLSTNTPDREIVVVTETPPISQTEIASIPTADSTGIPTGIEPPPGDTEEDQVVPVVLEPTATVPNIVPTNHPLISQSQSGNSGNQPQVIGMVSSAQDNNPIDVIVVESAETDTRTLFTYASFVIIIALLGVAVFYSWRTINSAEIR